MATDDDFGFEIENELPEESAPWGKFYAVEMTDHRIGDSERCLLWWIRYRACGKLDSWVSYETLAEDLGVDERTIRRRAEKLRDTGHLICKSNGFGRSKSKILVRASTIYGKHLNKANQYLGRKRSHEDIHALRGGLLDNSTLSIEDIRVRSERPPSYRADLPVHIGQTAPVLPDTAVRLEIANQEIANHEATNSQSAAASLQPGSGEVRSDSDLTDAQSLDVIGTRKIPLPRDEREAVALAAIQERMERSGKAADERKRKSDAKRAAKAVADAEAPYTRSDGEGDRPEKKKVRERYSCYTAMGDLSSYGLEELFGDLRRDFFPKAPPYSWSKADKRLALMLLQTYNDKVVKDVVRKLYENWDHFKERLKKTDPGSVPEIGWLYAFRAKVFDIVMVEGHDYKVRDLNDL